MFIGLPFQDIFKNKLTEKMPSYNPPIGFYTQLTLPRHICPKMFMGPDGYHFKYITELSGCNYLWFDWSRGVIEIWGKEAFRLPKALKMLNNRIKLFRM